MVSARVWKKRLAEPLLLRSVLLGRRTVEDHDGAVGEGIPGYVDSSRPCHVPGDDIDAIVLGKPLVHLLLELSVSVGRSVCENLDPFHVLPPSFPRN